MLWADLHCHTTCSDGSATPEEVLRLAKQTGLHGLSITDHDTIEAYKTALPIAKDIGIDLRTGIELSCQFQGHSIHLLGYDFDLTGPSVHQLCQRHIKRREDRNRAIIEKLQEHGIDVQYEELPKEGKTVGRPHIAQIMVEKGYVASVREAFHQYIAEGKKCYAAGASFSVGEAIEVIRSARGKIFIAHPQLLPHDLDIEALLQFPFDGVECNYAKLSKASAQKWAEIAVSKGWLTSGGSDFHGAVKPEITLGCNGVDRDTFYKIFKHEL